MEVTLEKVSPIEEAFQRLRNAPLDAADRDIFLYNDADLRLIDLHPCEVNPTSLYILKEKIAFQRDLRAYLLNRYGVDTLQLSSALLLRDHEGCLFGMVPPYVEIVEERVSIHSNTEDRDPPPVLTLRIPVLVDGIHRLWIAKEDNLPVRCAVARDVSSEYPVYAYPNSWDDVVVCDSVPEQSHKKHYRRKPGCEYSSLRPLAAYRGDGIQFNR